MQLSDICVSLELAKQLKEAGYPQESVLRWHYYGSGKEWAVVQSGFSDLLINHAQKHSRLENAKESKWIAAPTAAEIGEQLRCGDFEMPYMFDSQWAQLKYGILKKTEANARAKMWLYLKQNNLLKD